MLAAVAVSLVVLADAACPAPDAVELKLQALRAPGAAAPRYVLEVGRSGESVLLTARNPDGAMWVQRELPGSAPCTELEDAAAVVLLAWEAQLAPGDVPVPEVTREAVDEPPVAALPSLAVRVNAGAQLWLSSASPTWGAQGAVELHGRWLGVELSVLGQGRRDVALGAGRASWSRFSMALGPVASLHLADGVDVSLGASVALGPFWVNGSGFDKPYALLDWDIGALAQAKVLLPGFWQLRPFIGVGGAWWFRRHVVEARAPDAVAVLPFLEASPAIGLVFTP